MTEDKLERTRRTYAAMNRGDFDTALELLDPDVEWLNPPGWPDRRDVRGHEAVKQAWIEAVEPFEDFTFKTQELIDGGDRTFHAIRLTGTGKASGVPVEVLWCQVAFFGSSGSVTRLENYFDRAEALNAAGVRT